jgi:hypothetical protein
MTTNDKNIENKCDVHTLCIKKAPSSHIPEYESYIERIINGARVGQ